MYHNRSNLVISIFLATLFSLCYSQDVVLSLDGSSLNNEIETAF